MLAWSIASGRNASARIIPRKRRPDKDGPTNVNDRRRRSGGLSCKTRPRMPIGLKGRYPSAGDGPLKADARRPKMNGRSGQERIAVEVLSPSPERLSNGGFVVASRPTKLSSTPARGSASLYRGIVACAGDDGFLAAPPRRTSAEGKGGDRMRSAAPTDVPGGKREAGGSPNRGNPSPMYRK